MNHASFLGGAWPSLVSGGGEDCEKAQPMSIDSMAGLDDFFAKKGKKKKRKPTVQLLEEVDTVPSEEEKTQSVTVTSANTPEVS